MAALALWTCYGYSRYMDERYTDAVRPEDRSAAIAEAREKEAEQRQHRLRLEALRDSGLVPECEHCEGEFVGRADARFCSTRCRVAAHRARVKAGHTPEERQREKDLGIVENFHHDMSAMVWIAGRLGPKARAHVLKILKNAVAEIEAQE